MWPVVIVLPVVQAYTLTTFGFGLGGMIVGRIID
jgi:hypothetical protein